MRIRILASVSLRFPRPSMAGCGDEGPLLLIAAQPCLGQSRDERNEDRGHRVRPASEFATHCSVSFVEL